MIYLQAHRFLNLTLDEFAVKYFPGLCLLKYFLIIDYLSYANYSIFNTLNMARPKNNETLNFQIDKLSEAIESMMKGFETLQTPKLLDPEGIRAKPGNQMHTGLIGDNDVSDPDSFSKEVEYDPDKIELYYQRALMVSEDFRSFENRKIDNKQDEQGLLQVSTLLEMVSNRIYEQCGLVLPSNDVEEFVLNIEKALKKQIICSLVDLHGFILKLCEIIQLENPEHKKITVGDTELTINIKERPRKRFQKPDYTAIYDSSIEKLLENPDLPDEIKAIGRIKKNLLVTMNLEVLKASGIDSIRQEIEQSVLELELLKKKFNLQLESLSKFSKQLRQKDVELIKIREKIDLEREQLELEKNHVNDLENKYVGRVQEIKTKISEICPDVSTSVEIKPRSSIESNGRFSPMFSPFRTSTPVQPLKNSEASDELAALQTELSVLESQPQESGVMIKINRLKTQISTIRTTLAISHSMRNSTNAGKLSSEHKRNGSSNSSFNEFPISPSPIPRSGCSSPVVPDTAYLSKRSLPKPLPPGTRKPAPRAKETPDELEIVRNQLRVQESRLKEREDLVEEKEKRLQRTWMKLPNSEDLITLVQKELNYLAIIKRDYEDKFEELNLELLAFAKKNSTLKAKERELETKIIETSKEKKALEEEKRMYEQKFESILNLFEEMS
jgi:hypothetical protein